MRRRLRACMLSLAAAIGLPLVAEAAVRRCEPSVTSGPHEAATEIEARRLAMAEWLRLSGRISVGHANWRLAVNKAVVCAPLPAGRHRCEAYGSPCIISQVPDPDARRLAPLPPGTLPQKPAEPAPAPAPTIPKPKPMDG